MLANRAEQCYVPDPNTTTDLDLDLDKCNVSF